MTDPTVTWSLLTMIAGAVSTTSFLTWFISRQFSNNRSLIYRIISLHNKEDDDRFEAIKDDLWDIRLRNAQKDGEVPPTKKTFPRRRYVSEEMESGG